MNSFLSRNAIYKDLKETFTKNANKPITEWTDFYSNFKRRGKQGLVGIINEKSHLDKKYVFKLSQYINFLVNHEFEILDGLDKLSFCPNFCRVYGKLNSSVEPTVKNSGNPFDIKSKFPIKKDILLYEYINGKGLYDYIKRVDKYDDIILYQLIKQVLLTISLAQRAIKFTHYDLHSQNIMVNKCDKNIVFLYVLDNENQFCIPSYGYHPVLIDFGFSYSSNLEDKPLWNSLIHTHVGFISNRFDRFSDAKLFLSTISNEMCRYRKSKNSKKLRNIAKNIFSEINVDMYSGWDKCKDIGAAEYITKILESENDNSNLFTDYDHYCIDILQSLIILPLERQKYKSIKKIYGAFIREWIKIEKITRDPFYNMYILKELISSVRLNRHLYLVNDTKDIALRNFKDDILRALGEISKFADPKNVKYEVLMCSLILLGKNMEGILYDIIHNRMKEKEKEYSRMKIKNNDEVFAIVDTNINDEYKYSEDTIVVVFDSVNKRMDEFKLDCNNLIKELNNSHSLERGIILYQKYTSIINESTSG